jgi:hypothetical protein
MAVVELLLLSRGLSDEINDATSLSERRVFEQQQNVLLRKC